MTEAELLAKLAGPSVKEAKAEFKAAEEEVRALEKDLARLDAEMSAAHTRMRAARPRLFKAAWSIKAAKTRAEAGKIPPEVLDRLMKAELPPDSPDMLKHELVRVRSSSRSREMLWTAKAERILALLRGGQ